MYTLLFAYALLFVIVVASITLFVLVLTAISQEKESRKKKFESRKMNHRIDDVTNPFRSYAR